MEAQSITIIVTKDGVDQVIGVPQGIEIIVDDKVEDTMAFFGSGDNNILSQRV